MDIIDFLEIIINEGCTLRTVIKMCILYRYAYVHIIRETE